jgi:hypothetical protein
MEDTCSLKYVLGLCSSYFETAKPYGGYAGKQRAGSFGLLITALADFAKLCKFTCADLRNGSL